MTIVRALFPCLVFAAIVVAGCGGSGIATPVGPTPAPSATIPVGPTPASVTLSGGGYTLSFVVPAVSAGSTATMSATLTTALPSGVVAPTTWVRQPRTVGVPLNALAYLIVKTTAPVGFSSAPSFAFTLPSGTSVGAGQQTYLLWYDTYQSSAGWITLLGPGSVSGQTVTFPARSYGFTLHPNAQYVYALAITTQPAPTASPAPPPTPVPTSPPTAAPTATPSPAGPPNACPAPAAGTFPLAVKNNTGITSPLKIYVWGMAPPSTANAGQWVSLNDAVSGNTTLFGVSGSTINSFALPANGCINLPPLVSARIYFYFQTQNSGNSAIASHGPGSGASGPVPNNSQYTDDIANVWDYAEYTWYGPSQQMTFDLTAVDGVGIPSQFWLANGTTALAGPYGLPAGALGTSIAQLKALGDPWPGLVEQTQTTGGGTLWSRIVSPQLALGASAGTVSFDSSYMLAAPFGQSQSLIDQIWSTYTGSTFLHLSYPPYDGYGLVDASGNFQFYSTPNSATTPFATIKKPTNAGDIFGNSGVFAPSTGGIQALEMGRALSVNILRGTLPVPNPLPAGWPSTTQPFCGTSDWHVFYNGYLKGASVPSSTVMDWYSAIVHKNAINGLLFGFPDDDECNIPGSANALYAAIYGSNYSPGYQWSVVLNPF